jgi:hypothetical protein
MSLSQWMNKKKDARFEHPRINAFILFGYVVVQGRHGRA